MKRILPAFIVLTLAIVACKLPGVTALSQPTTAAPTQDLSSSLPAPAQPAPADGTLEALYQNVIPGVVKIYTGTALGSGFMFDDKGHVVTNQHVVNGVNEVEIDFTSGYKAHGTVIGSDTDADLAVIKVDAPASEIHPLTMGDSDKLLVGQSVVAIGNPFGLSGTMTLGIISGLGRTQVAHAASSGGYFSTADIIQTDAAINPGNSGGPLFNMNGEVVGINQSIETNNTNVSGQPTNSGVGFSISINLVKRVVPVLITDGKYQYPYLGISSSSEFSLAAIEALGLTTYKGAYVTSVTPGGPADKAGIKAGTIPTSIQGLNAGGDVVIGFDGKPINTFDDLLAMLTTNKSPGDTVVLTILRDGKQMDVTVKLGVRP